MKIADFEVGLDKPFFLIAGPCMMESEEICLEVATKMKEITSKLGINYIFKASFDKANRTSVKSFRGQGLKKGLEVFAKIKSELNIPVLTDVHEKDQAAPLAEVIDAFQIPAFLCRQTDFVVEVAKQGLPVNIKKGQFISPWEMAKVIEKARSTGNDKIMACERGYMFGYNNLVVDMRSLAIMRQDNTPVVADVTHAVQLPGARGDSTGGQGQFIPLIARAAVAVGVSGIFMETHPRPSEALSDGPNSVPLDKVEALLTLLKEIDQTVKAKADFAPEKL